MLKVARALKQLGRMRRELAREIVVAGNGQWPTLIDSLPNQMYLDSVMRVTRIKHRQLTLEEEVALPLVTRRR